MKTTIDLPEDLVTELKLRATLEKKKMKEVAAEALRAGLKAPGPSDDADLQRRLEILKNIKPPTKEEHEAHLAYLNEYREDRETMFDRDR